MREKLAPPRLRVAMAATLRPRKVVGCFRCVKYGLYWPSTRRRYAVDATDGSTPPDVGPTSKEEAVLAATSEVGARDNDSGNGMVQVSTSKDEETGVQQ